MKRIAFVLLTVLAVASATAEHTTNVTAFINGKRVEFTSDIRTQVAQKSVGLLASCAYMNAKPKWGAAATEPQSIEDAQNHSHLRLVFSGPVKVEVPNEKFTLQVREMVISLPLVTAGIWVRTGEGVQYFAKFDHTICNDLKEQLREAVKL